MHKELINHLTSSSIEVFDTYLNIKIFSKRDEYMNSKNNIKECNLLFLVIVLLFVFTVSLPSIIAPSHPFEVEENILYITVIEQVGDAARVLTDAKVSLAHGSIDEEQSMPVEWGDVPVNDNGQAVFSNLDSGTYIITAKASGYISAQKEFIKQTGVTGHISIALEEAPEGVTGSVRVAVLINAPQGPAPLSTANINILKAGELIISSDTKNTQGKEGVVFSDLSIGEDYEAHITAPGYESQRKNFVIEMNMETWLPIDLGEAVEVTVERKSFEEDTELPGDDIVIRTNMPYPEKDLDKIIEKPGDAISVRDVGVIVVKSETEVESGKEIIIEYQQSGKEGILPVEVKTSERLEYKDSMLLLNNKEIKIMPDTASEIAISTLQLKKEIEIELKDTGKPIYEIIGNKEVKIFGLFKKEMSIKIEINAETGNIEKIKKPWWSFLAKE